MRFVSVMLAACATLSPAAAIAASVTGKISFSGYDQAVGSTSVVNATGLNFANSSGSAVTGSFGTLNGYAAAQGSFAALGACGSITPGCGTIQDIANFNSSTPISGFLSLTTGGPVVSFDLTNITDINRVASTGALFLTGRGVINFSGYDATPGTFTLNTQGSNIVSFSGSIIADAVTPPAVPEPATWAMMILGMGAVGVTMRRRNVTTRVSYAA